MMTREQAMQVLEKVLRAADGGCDVVASIGGGAHASTRFSDNVITQNVASESAGLSVSCAYGQQHGSASTNDLSDESLKAVVARAQLIARVSPPDPEHMPPVTPAEAGEYPKVEAFFEPTMGADPREKAARIGDCAARVAAAGYRLSGAYASGGGFHALANSAGVRAYHRSTRADAHVTVLGPNGSGWAQQVGDDIAAIDLAATVGRALDIAQRAQHPADIAPGRYTTILSPAAVADLIPTMIRDAKATDEGRTFLRGKLGQQVCGANVTIRSEPADPRCPGGPFQSNGMASRALCWVEKGVLRNLSYSRYWAKKQGKEPTGGAANVIMESVDGAPTVEQLIASTGRGLLVTRLWYIRTVDPMKSLLTGMTRDGLFLIEDGRIAGPVKNMRFNESVMDMLNRVEALSAPERAELRAFVPALRIRDFNFSSGTKF